MEMSASHLIRAPILKVWAALNDPEILKSCIAGCKSLDATEDNGFDRISHRTFWRDNINDRLRTDLIALNSQGFALSASNLGADSTSGTTSEDFLSASRAAPLSVWPLDGRFGDCCPQIWIQHVAIRP